LRAIGGVSRVGEDCMVNEQRGEVGRYRTEGPRPRIPANRFGLDYAVEAGRMGPPPSPILDVHAHVSGERAGLIYREVAEAFGVRRVWTQVPLPAASAMRATLGDFAKFIAFPNFRSEDRERSFREGFLDDIRAFHDEFGAKIVKFWNAPRLRDFFPGAAGKDITELDGAWRVRQAELAQRLGMMFMVHVADPDTWFATKYANASVYGAKRDHYRGLEVMMARFPGPWLLAHMGGWSEDLDFLDGLLERHANAYLDTSATKWVVRELSAHPPERVVRFFTRWRGRILFGSDIVTTDEHLAAKQPPKPGERAHPMADLASNPEEAAELYASRYFALRTMFETGYRGESPIADPDLAMVDPDRFDAMSAPRLTGLSLSREMLAELYAGAAERLLASFGGT
jgi:hypothetical protein